MRARREANDQQTRGWIAKPGDRLAPVFLPQIGASLNATDLLAIRNQTGAAAAIDNFAVQNSKSFRQSIGAYPIADSTSQNHDYLRGGYRLGRNFGITVSRNVKTAISIDSDLLQAADETARQMGLNRSRFFALAVNDFLKRQQQEHMLRQLNEVYTKTVEPAEKRLLKGIKARVRRTIKERW